MSTHEHHTRPKSTPNYGPVKSPKIMSSPVYGCDKARRKLMVDSFQVEARNKDKLSDMSNLAEKLGGSNSSEND